MSRFLLRSAFSSAVAAKLPHKAPLHRPCPMASSPTLSRSAAIAVATIKSKRAMSTSMNSSSASLPSWATYDPQLLGTNQVPYAVQNLVAGQWTDGALTSSTPQLTIPHPLDRNKAPIFTIPDTTDIGPFVDSLRACPKTGLHNPLKRPERYVQYGEISRLVSEKKSIVTHIILCVHVCATRMKRKFTHIVSRVLYFLSLDRLATP
jgi:hypothetical protein